MVVDKNDVRIIRLLIDSVVFSNYDQVFKSIKNAISDDDSRIVLDMEKVEFMDSLSIGMLVPLLLYARRMGGDLVVTQLNGHIRELFSVLRLDRILQVYETVEEAVAGFEEE